MTSETQITVDCWAGRWKILGLAFTCLWAFVVGGVVVIRRVRS